MEQPHFNELSQAEAERLAYLAEELAEVIQAIGKILRHGYESANPFDLSKETNRHRLERELGDAKVAVNLMTDAGDLASGRINAHADRKREHVWRYLHHQGAPDRADL